MWERYGRMKQAKGMARVLVNTRLVSTEACIHNWMTERNSDVDMSCECFQLGCRTEAEAPELLLERLLG